MRLQAPPKRATNPYPDDWDRLDAFDYLAPLSLIRPVGNLLERLGEDGDYILQHDFDCAVSIDGERRMLTAPRGLVTDLTSVPSLLRIFVGRVGPWLEAAIVHDYLYVAWAMLDGRGVRSRDRLFADRVMLLAMEAAAVRPWRRYAIYWGVRLFGWMAYRRADRELAFADLDDRTLDTPLVIPQVGGQSGTLSMPAPPMG